MTISAASNYHCDCQKDRQTQRTKKKYWPRYTSYKRYSVNSVVDDTSDKWYTTSSALSFLLYRHSWREERLVHFQLLSHLQKLQSNKKQPSPVKH